MTTKAPTRYPLPKLHSSTFVVDNRPRLNNFILVFPPPFLLTSSGSFRREFGLIITNPIVIDPSLLLRTLALNTA